MIENCGNSTKRGSKKCSNSKQDCPGEAPPNQDFHKVIVLLVTSRDREFVRRFCHEKLKLANTEEVIERALKEITLAADFDIRNEVGKAVIQLDDLYDKSVRVQNIQSALAVRKEKSKTLGIYPTADRLTTENPQATELELIDKQISPFLPNLPEGVPVDEKLRLLLIDYMKLKNAGTPARQAPVGDGGAKLSGVTRKTRDLPAPADQRPRKKK